MESSKKKLIASIPIVLVSKETSKKVGKINDSILPEKCVITKDPQSKSFKLVENKPGKGETRYTGNAIAEQSSKYLVLQYNPETGRMEVSPAGDWYTFKKDINYQTISLEEAEEKMKGKSVFLDYIRSKGVLPTKSKKEKKPRGEITSRGGGRVPFGRLNDEDEDMEDEVRPQLFERLEEQSEEERPEDMDPELKDVPSDIEEGFIKGKKGREEEEKRGIDSILESSDSGIFGGDDEEDEEPEEDEEDIDEDQGYSDIDEKEDLTPEQENYININSNMKNLPNIMSNANTKEQDFVGVKRRADEAALSPGKDKKRLRSDFPMEEMLNNILAKNRRMTYEKIVKELSRQFSKSEIDSQLHILLNNVCDKYPQDGEYYYFKKSEK